MASLLLVESSLAILLCLLLFINQTSLAEQTIQKPNPGVLIDDSDDWEPHEPKNEHPILSAHLDTNPGYDLNSALSQAALKKANEKVISSLNEPGTLSSKPAIEEDEIVDETATSESTATIENLKTDTFNRPDNEEDESSKEPGHDEDLSDDSIDSEDPSPNPATTQVPSSDSNLNETSTSEPKLKDAPLADLRAENETSTAVNVSETLSIQPNVSQVLSAEEVIKESNHTNVSEDLSNKTDDIQQQSNQQPTTVTPTRLSEIPSISPTESTPSRLRQPSQERKRTRNMLTSASPEPEQSVTVEIPDKPITGTRLNAAPNAAQEQVTPPSPVAQDSDDQFMNNQQAASPSKQEHIEVSTSVPNVNVETSPSPSSHQSLDKNVAEKPEVLKEVEAQDDDASLTLGAEQSTTDMPTTQIPQSEPTFQNVEMEVTKQWDEPSVSSDTSRSDWSEHKKEEEEEKASSFDFSVLLSRDILLSVSAISVIAIVALIECFRDKSSPLTTTNMPVPVPPAAGVVPRHLNRTKEREANLIKMIGRLKMNLELAPLQAGIENLHKEIKDRRRYQDYLKTRKTLDDENDRMRNRIEMDKYSRLFKIRELQNLSTIPDILRYMEYDRIFTDKSDRMFKMRVEIEVREEQMKLLQQLPQRFLEHYESLSSQIQEERMKSERIENEQDQFSRQLEHKNIERCKINE